MARKQLGGDVHSLDGISGMGGANEISRTANHLSTLQLSWEEVAMAEKIDWQLEGVAGGYPSFIWLKEAWGTPALLCMGQQLDG